LIRAAKGRIINISSVGGKITLPFGGPLCSSKYALESINDALRMELRPWGIHVILIAPGSIRTPAAAKLLADSKVMASTFSPEGAAQYGASYYAFVQSLVKQEEKGIAPEVVAEVVYHALTTRSPKQRYPIGPQSRLILFIGAWLPASVMDVLRTRLVHVFQPFGSLSK